MIISWNTTNQCNMYCDHCYRESGLVSEGELDTEQGKKMIEEIKKAGFRIMIFSGGEPLMRPDIVELIAYASSLGLRPVVGSNGTLLTRELALALKDAGLLRIGISLDSLDVDRHNQLRKYGCAFEEAVRGMEICREIGLEFQVHTTVMKWNIPELDSLTDFAIEKGAKAHHIFFLIPTGRGLQIEGDMLNEQEYEDVINQLLDKQKEVDIEIKPTCAPQFMRIAREKQIDMRFTKGCIAGMSYCIVSPKGDVQPCAYFDLRVGNVKDTPFDVIWRESEVFKAMRTEDYSGGCGVCGHKSICGGCRARAYYNYEGDYMAEDSWCILNKETGDDNGSNQ